MRTTSAAMSGLVDGRPEVVREKGAPALSGWLPSPRHQPRNRSLEGAHPQRWATFVRNHAHAIVACDFFTRMMVGFRVLYVFIVLEVGTRRIVHWNVTAHPTSAWTIQQFRAVITPETFHRFVLHDHDGVFSATVDQAIGSMGRHVLKTPARTPQANAFCERLIGRCVESVSIG